MYPNSRLDVLEEAETYGTVEAMPTDVSGGGGANGRIGTAEEGRTIGVELYVLVDELSSDDIVIDGVESICIALSSTLFLQVSFTLSKITR